MILTISAGWTLFIVILLIIMFFFAEKWFQHRIISKKDDPFIKVNIENYYRMKMEYRKKIYETTAQNEKELDKAHPADYANEFFIEGVYTLNDEAIRKVEELHFGDEIRLQYFPDDTFNKKTIRVFSNAVHIGYVNEYQADKILPYLNECDYVAFILIVHEKYNYSHADKLTAKGKVYFSRKKPEVLN